MKKNFLLFCLSMISIFAFAQYDVSYYHTGELKAKPGETVPLTINLQTGGNDVLGYQMYIQLPNGVTIPQNEDEEFMIEYNSDRFSLKSDGSQWTSVSGVFLVAGATKKAIKDEDGVFATIQLSIPKEIELGEKQIIIKNIAFTVSDNGNQTSKQDEFTIPLKIYDNFSVSATSANENMGSVTIAPAGDAVESGTTITATATAVDGYSFVNWTAGEKEVSKDNPYNFILADNTELTANFKAIAYQVVFMNDGAEVQKGDLDFASEITAPKDPTKDGYTFQGWWAGETKFEMGATVPVNGITYEAKWQINQYTITFDTDGGSEVAAITQDYASAIAAPADPTKTGYTFKAWDPALPKTMPVDGFQTKATWTINQYTVKFVADEKVVSEETLDYGKSITAPEVPAKEGHTGAWDKEVAETVPAENVTYTAVYTPIDYTITFDTDGGSEVAAITLPYGSAIKAPENPTKEGYTFKAWDPALPKTMPVDGFQTKATWTINQYTVKFVSEGETIYEKELDYGAEITAPADPTRAGWVFLGWSPEVDATVPAKDVTYTAQWKQDIITLRFVFWDDNKVEYQYKPGEEITEIPEVPAREGYTFKGWDKTIPEVMPEDVENGVLIITANWSVNKYDVYFIANGKTVKKQTMTYGSTIVAPEAPEVEGYTFVGWTPEVAETVPANNVWYEAVYEVNTYTVTYYVDGEVVNVAEVKYGEEIPAYEPTVEEGMKFDGWQEEIPAVMPATNLEIHGTTSGIETAIKNIVAKFGESFDVYNVSGRLVQRVNGASDITRIPAGMYIINGTKVVIRKD